MIEYTVIEASSAGMLQDRLNALGARGWTLAGPHVVTPNPAWHDRGSALHPAPAAFMYSAIVVRPVQERP